MAAVVTIYWYDPESSGYTDLIPENLISRNGHGRTHVVTGPRGSWYQAKCDVAVHQNYVDLDYRPHQKFNDAQGMYIGVMRLRRGNGSISDVQWKESGERRFVPCKTTIGLIDESVIGVSDLEALEGGLELVNHLRRERKPKLVCAKKKAVLAASGELVCEACGFNFATAYRDLGEGFCEVHHRTALAGGRRATRLEDLAILCSNCHRMIHHTDPMQSVEGFRDKYFQS